MTSFSILNEADADAVEFYVVIPADGTTPVLVDRDSHMWDAVEAAAGPVRIVPVPAGLVADGAHGMARAVLDTATTDTDGESADATWWHTPGYGWELDAFTPHEADVLRHQWREFVVGSIDDLLAAVADRGYADSLSSPSYSLGYDFVLTRQHQGTGFWDRATDRDLGRRLTDAAHPHGNITAHAPEDANIADLIES